MPDAALERVLDALRSSGRVVLTSETQVACGRIVLTVMPDLAADEAHGFRLEFPGDYDRSEAPVVMLFVMEILGSSLAASLLPEVGRAMRSGQPFERVVGRWRLRTFCERDHYVVQFAATSSSSA